MRNTSAGDFNKIESDDFKSFWFEGNLWFGWVNNQELFEDLLTVYPNAGDAKRAENFKGGDKFGFRMECNGEETLRDWMNKW